jgi:hypothetical protein
MPRLHLFVERDPESVVVLVRRPDGTNTAVANLRVCCRLFVARHPKRFTAVVDTGAPTAVFPHAVWKRFPADVRWLPFADGSARKPATLAGRSFQYRFGVVSVRFFGREASPELPPVEVMGQFEQFDPMNPHPLEPKHLIVGLQYGPLEGRFLVVGPRHALPERAEAWVTDDPLASTTP